MTLRALAAALTLAATLPACGGSSRPAPGSGASTRFVTDTAGARVPLPRDVRRVVTTVPGLTKTMLAMGLGTLLVGVSDHDATQGALAGLPHVPAFPTIPAETVAGLAPDLLLVDRVLSGHDLDALRRRFPGTFATDSRSLDGLRETFLRLGEALGQEVRARHLADDLDRARAESRVAGRPRVLLLAWASPPMALGPGALLDDMVRAVGGENVAWDLGRPSGEIASEVVRERAPEWILLTGGTFPDALRSAWAQVPAVARDRVVDLTGDDFVQAGPATAGALRALARILSAGDGSPR